jgi:hypothetical protein
MSGNNGLIMILCTFCAHKKKWSQKNSETILLQRSERRG